ncbi:MAG: hypothetical protein WD971_04095 [Pirellulales bacterium]
MAIRPTPWRDKPFSMRRAAYRNAKIELNSIFGTDARNDHASRYSYCLRPVKACRLCARDMIAVRQPD